MSLDLRCALTLAPVTKVASENPLSSFSCDGLQLAGDSSAHGIGGFWDVSADSKGGEGGDVEHKGPLELQMTAFQTFVWARSQKLRDSLRQCYIGRCKCELTPQVGSNVTRALIFSGNNSAAAYSDCSDHLYNLPATIVAEKSEVFTPLVIKKLCKAKDEDVTGGVKFSELFSKSDCVWVDVDASSNMVTVSEVLVGGRGARGRANEVFKTIRTWVKMESAQYLEACECVSCMDTFAEIDGLTCSAEMKQDRHFVCTKTCLEPMIKSQLASIRSQGGALKCCMCDATVPMQAVAKCAPRLLFESLTAAVVDSQLEAKYMELEEGFDQRLKTRIRELIEGYSGQDNLQLKYDACEMAKVARNDVLNLACPHCKAAYSEFDGCMALACASCKKTFCGYCHKGFENSRGTHEHVRECLMNETANGSYYASTRQLVVAQRKYRTQKLKKFLRANKKDLQNATIIELKKDLDDLGIDPAALFNLGALA
jgi:protein-arginine kinase activator protein McsA